MLTDHELCMRHSLEVVCASYDGGDPRSDASYGPLVRQLSGNGLGSRSVGGIIGAGEPSLFMHRGRQCMGFIIARYRDAVTDDVDFDIGWVCEAQ